VDASAALAALVEQLRTDSPIAVLEEAERRLKTLLQQELSAPLDGPALRELARLLGAWPRLGALRLGAGLADATLTQAWELTASLRLATPTLSGSVSLGAQAIGSGGHAISVQADATLALPLLVTGLAQRIPGARHRQVMAADPRLIDPHLDWGEQVKSIRLEVDQDRAGRVARRGGVPELVGGATDEQLRCRVGRDRPHQRGQAPIPFSANHNHYLSNLEAAVSSSLTPDDMREIRTIDRNCRLIKGQVFLWKDGQSWEDLWDVKGEITPA
jgi:hypothetical protein